MLLISDPLIRRFFAAGRARPATAGIAQVFDVRAAVVAAGVVFYAQDRSTAGEHFGDGFDFDVAQAALFEKMGPALVSGEEVFERAGFVSRDHPKHESLLNTHRHHQSRPS